MLNTLTSVFNMPPFFNFLFENTLVILAYFTLLIEVSQTFGAIIVAAILLNFTILLISVAHSSSLTEFTPSVSNGSGTSSTESIKALKFIKFQ